MKKRTGSVKATKVVKKEESVGTENVMSQVLRARYEQAVFNTRYGS